MSDTDVFPCSMAAIESALKEHLPTAHSSLCSMRRAPTSRTTAGRLGKMPTTFERRLISL